MMEARAAWKIVSFSMNGREPAAGVWIFAFVGQLDKLRTEWHSVQAALPPAIA